MRAALLITLVAFGSFAQGRFDRFNARTSQGRSTRGFEQSNYAFLEFAPASGAGMGTACACTTPTSAKGDALTFTRTGDATCSKQGLATTGIANGDLVVCTANQPRVESSGGVLGLRVEGARTNAVLRSQELDNAAWVDDSSPVSPITITANAATAPDGTLTAERFQIPSRTAAQWSLRYQAVATGVSGSSSVYVKGNGQSGVFSIALAGSLSPCIDCAYNASTWTRCEVSGASAGFVWLGTASGYGSCAGGTKPAVDAFVWGAQTEGAGAVTYATSYIPTVAAAVTRNVEVPYFARSVPAPSGVCSSASVEVPALAAFTGGSGLYAPMLSGAAGSAVSPYLWPFTAGTGASLAIDGVGSSGAPTTFSPATDNPTLAGRYIARHAGVKWQYCVNGSCATHVNDTTWLAPTYSHIKLDVNGVVAGAAIWTRVQVDPDALRCTP